MPNKPKNTSPTLIWLDRSGLVIYTPHLSDVARFVFPETMVRDLEIIDLNAFSTQLASFFTQLALPVSDATLIVAKSIYFVQEVQSKKSAVNQTEEGIGKMPTAPNISNQDTITAPEKAKDPTLKAQEEEQRQAFVKAVPFSDVFSAIVTIEKNRYIIALNREFYDPVVKLLEAHHLSVTKIIPDLAIPSVAEAGLTLATGPTAIANETHWLESNLIIAKPSLELANMQVMPDKNSPERKRMIVMAVGFAALALVFGLLLFNMIQTNNADKAKIAAAKAERQAQLASASAQLALTLTPSPSPTTNPTDTKNTNSSQLASAAAVLKVAILNGSGQAGQASLVEAQLNQVGFTQTTTGNAARSNSGNTLVVVKPSVSPPLRQLLLDTLTQFGLQPIITESSEITEDIRISTAAVTPNSTTNPTPTQSTTQP